VPEGNGSGSASSEYRAGLGRSARENAGAFAFSIMITSVFGVVSALERRPAAGDVFLFAAGGVLGFVAVAWLGQLVDDPEAEAERTRILLLASALSLFSVLGAVGAGALVAWLGQGWYVWLVAPLAGCTAFLLLNGLEFAVAQRGEEEDEQGGT
jgi:hypothetical protein